MDERIGTSQHLYGSAATPELEGCEPTAPDSLPIVYVPAASSQPPVILVVDDEPDVGQILQRLLHDLLPQHEILVATDPITALWCIRSRTVALVITDFHMPKISGIHLAAQIKVHTPDTPVLLMTAYPTPALARLVQQRDIHYYLPKPFRLAELERMIVAALAAYGAATR